MSDYIITNKTIIFIIILAVMVAAAVGFIFYNLGLSRSSPNATYTETQPPLAQEENELTNQPTAPTNQPSEPPEATETETVEIPISGEPVVSQGQTIINGTVNAVTGQGLTVDVENLSLNSATGTFSQTVVTYSVTVTAKTKIVEQRSIVTVPPGQDPQVTTTYKNIKLSNLTAGDKVTVFTDQEISGKNITATEIRLLP